MAPHRPDHDKQAPPAADPRAGSNPGYAETEPRDRGEAHLPVNKKPRPNPDEPGIERDTDEQADPTKE